MSNEIIIYLRPVTKIVFNSLINAVLVNRLQYCEFRIFYLVKKRRKYDDFDDNLIPDYLKDNDDDQCEY